MRIFVNQKIRALFLKILLCIIVFPVISVLVFIFSLENAAVYAVISCICMGICILAVLYLYFRDQDRIMQDAVLKLQEYISGNRTARIECDEEGELNRLFHEVNSLAAILNAHAENESRSKKFMKDTISDISHQLKTPLAALNIYNGIIQEEAKDMPEVEKFAGLSEQELDRIETLVQNLLKITRLDAGTIVLEKGEESVSGMLKDIEGRFSYRVGQEGKELLLSGDEDTTLFCDRDWMIEAIGNIVKNAFDHTKRGDNIRIRWKRYASMVQVVIQDNGSGIHPEDLHHIFKRFYRSRFSKDTRGIGLGLSLAKAVVEAHNGTIEVDSELGEGTVFTINFLIPTKL